IVRFKVGSCGGQRSAAPCPFAFTQSAPIAAVSTDKNAMGFRRGRPNSPYSEAPPIAGRDTNGRTYQGTRCTVRNCLNHKEGKKKSRGFNRKVRRETRE